MGEASRNATEILNCFVSGYHEFSLDPPVHLTFASKNLCEMLGCSEAELQSDTADLFAPWVHPADCEIYAGCVRALSEKEQTLSVQYRLVKKNGEILYVTDSATSKRLPDGTMWGCSTLSDRTEIEKENTELRLIGDAVPCGILRYTCEKNPRVTYVSEKMIEIMRVPGGGDSGQSGDSGDPGDPDQPGDPGDPGQLDPLSLYKSNIYLMIAPESRANFARILSEVFIQGHPRVGEVSVTRGDGSRGRLFGWVTKCRSADGGEEFQSICVDVTEHYEHKRAELTDQYLQALTGVYDLIFEYDHAARTVRYLHGTIPEAGDFLLNLPLQFEQATDRWLDVVVDGKDRERVRSFLKTYVLEGALTGDGPPPQVFFRSGGDLYQGILLQAGSGGCYFCCRLSTADAETASLQLENDSLKNLNENMQELMKKFSDGVVAFEITGKYVKPLFASDNAFAFFRYTKEDWERVTRERQPIREFVSGTGVDYKEFEKLFATGEAEFAYRDVQTGKRRVVKAVCSGLAVGGDSPRYIMLYSMDSAAAEQGSGEEAERHRVYIRTFGYFDVFVDDRPIMFKNEKTKELFALMVDRRGGYVSPDEAIGFLWEDEPASALVLARYRKVALRLKNLLEEYGISDVVEYVGGKRRIVTEKVDCDLYDYLSQKEEYASLFNGSYLTNYSWGEITLGELMSRM